MSAAWIGATISDEIQVELITDDPTGLGRVLVAIRVRGGEPAILSYAQVDLLDKRLKAFRTLARQVDPSPQLLALRQETQAAFRRAIKGDVVGQADVAPVVARSDAHDDSSSSVMVGTREGRGDGPGAAEVSRPAGVTTALDLIRRGLDLIEQYGAGAR